MAAGNLLTSPGFGTKPQHRQLMGMKFWKHGGSWQTPEHDKALPAFAYKCHLLAYCFICCSHVFLIHPLILLLQKEWMQITAWSELRQGTIHWPPRLHSKERVRNPQWEMVWGENPSGSSSCCKDTALSYRSRKAEFRMQIFKLKQTAN